MLFIAERSETHSFPTNPTTPNHHPSQKLHPHSMASPAYSILILRDCGFAALGTTTLKMPFFKLALTAS
jgi:hypothetical protein